MVQPPKSQHSAPASFAEAVQQGLTTPPATEHTSPVAEVEVTQNVSGEVGANQAASDAEVKAAGEPHVDLHKDDRETGYDNVTPTELENEKSSLDIIPPSTKRARKDDSSSDGGDSGSDAESNRGGESGGKITKLDPSQDLFESEEMTPAISDEEEDEEEEESKPTQRTSL